MGRRNFSPPRNWPVAGAGHVLIGGVPYPVTILPDEGLRPGYELLWLREDVGVDGEFTSDEATTFFAAGTLIVGQPVDNHATTGLPVFEIYGANDCVRTDESDAT